MPAKKRNVFVPLHSFTQNSQTPKTFIVPKKGNHAIQIKSADSVTTTDSSYPAKGSKAGELRPVNGKVQNGVGPLTKPDMTIRHGQDMSSGHEIAIPEMTSQPNELITVTYAGTVSLDNKEQTSSMLRSETTSENSEDRHKLDHFSSNQGQKIPGPASNASPRGKSPPFRSKLNILARKHVPLWLKLVNESYAIEIQAPSLKRIDYDAYRATLAGSLVLPPPTLADPPRPEPCPISYETLHSTHYQTYWHQRLQNEFTAQEIQLDAYGLYNVEISIEDPMLNLYRFRLPGLRENTPRVDIGDFILIRPLSTILQSTITAEASWWDQTRDGIAPGFVGQQHNAITWSITRRDETVQVRLGNLLPKYSKCNIAIPIQKHKCAPLWRAVSTIHDTLVPGQTWLNSILFPNPDDGVIQTSLSRGAFTLKWVDPELNFEQKRAVQAVVDANYGHVPYLISGPPGTGKSKTIVEIALQLLHTTTTITPHLLICTPSDAAADTLLIRLSKSLTPRELFRLNNWTRLVTEVPGEVRPYCHVDINSLHSLPPFEELMKMQVVVTTCRDANMLIDAGLTNLALAEMAFKLMSLIAPSSSQPPALTHWTALLLDEAAQATEPEALIPLSVIIPTHSHTSTSECMPQFVLAGDEHQLGPLLASQNLMPLEFPIKTTGLEISLFQRLFARDLYLRHPLSRANGAPPMTTAMLPVIRPPFTNLIRNYRSHPAILSTSSHLFYSDTLIPERPDISSAILSWPAWPSLRKSTTAWPILFHHNTSPDSVESVIAGDGTGAGSLGNRGEARLALDLVLSLLRHNNEYRTDFTERNSFPLQQEDVVVMSPFNAQVRHLRTVFRDASLYDVRIGPLEAFQGLESRVIVLCTTRTRLGQSPHGISKFVAEDKARGLGVIDEPNRFNVALTRAKEALLVIGNAEALTCTLDRCWLSFLEFCQRNALLSVDTPLGLRKGSYRFGDQSGMGKLEKALVYRAGLIERMEDEHNISQVNGTGTVPNTNGKFRLQGQMHDLDEMMRCADYQQFEEEEALFDEQEEDNDEEGVEDELA